MGAIDGLLQGDVRVQKRETIGIESRLNRPLLVAEERLREGAVLDEVELLLANDDVRRKLVEGGAGAGR